MLICPATHIVHLELMSDLTTKAFIASSRVDHLHSDNATTFVEANRELKDVWEFIRASENENVVTQYLSEQGIKRHFIFPRSPHFGGL